MESIETKFALKSEKRLPRRPKERTSPHSRLTQRALTTFPARGFALFFR